MSHTPPIYLLTDANILIDLAQAKALHLLRQVIHAEIATLVIPRCVYEEVRSEISEMQILELGITMVHIPLELKIEAVNMDEKRLSETDKTLLLFARKKQYSVWTNDSALHVKCKENGVSVFWEFEILLKLYKVRLVTANDLLELAGTIETINPRMKRMRERLLQDL